MTDTTPTIPARWFIAFFIVTMAATAIFSLVVVLNVRRDAVDTDAAVRLAAWGVLLHADTAQRFPTSAAELERTLFSRQVSADPTANATKGPRWPTTIESARADSATLDATTWPRELDAALATLEVQFPENSASPPNVTPRGHPTRPGTLAEVNSWLRGRADALSEERRKQGASSGAS